MSKKTDRRNAILCINKIKKSCLQSDVGEMHYVHSRKFKPNKRSQRILINRVFKIKAYVLSTKPNKNKIPDPNTLSQLPCSRIETMQYSLVGKFKRTRYNNFTYKDVMV
jgi:hypothetical protein